MQGAVRIHFKVLRISSLQLDLVKFFIRPDNCDLKALPLKEVNPQLWVRSGHCLAYSEWLFQLLLHADDVEQHSMGANWRAAQKRFNILWKCMNIAIKSIAAYQLKRYTCNTCSFVKPAKMTSYQLGLIVLDKIMQATHPPLFSYSAHLSASLLT